MCKKELTGLIKIQNQCLKLISPKTDSKDLYKNLQILKLTDMIQLELIKFSYKITKNQQPLPLQKLMDDRGRKKLIDIQPEGKVCQTYKNTQVKYLTRVSFVDQ